MRPWNPVGVFLFAACAALSGFATSVTATAQCNPGSLIGPNSGGNEGNAGNMVYFDLTAHQTITITEIHVRAGSLGSGITGAMEVYLGPSTYVGNQTNVSVWTLSDTVTGIPITRNAVSASPGVLSIAVLSAPGITLSTAPDGSPKTYAMALRSELSVWNHGYSNPGVPNPVSTPELTLTSGSATNGLFGSPVFSPRHPNLAFAYDCGGTGPTVASATPFGAGCGANPLSLTGDPAGLPLLGTTALSIIDHAPTIFVAAGIGFSRTTSHGMPLPLELSGYGAPGCYINSSADFGSWLPTVLTGPGAASFSFAIPNAHELLGLVLYAQAWSVAPGVNPAGLVSSNGLAWVIGNL